MKSILLATASAALLGMATMAQADTTIELQRFFGACEADYGTVTDVSKAVGECGIITSLVNKFEAENPDIKVNVTTVEWPGYNQLNAQLASNAAPDVVSVHYSAISDYSTRGLFMPLDDLFASAGIDPADFSDAARGGATKDGKMYALPFDNWTMLFHVNLNMMKEAGLVNADGTPILPTSVDEFFEQGKQFKEKTGKPYLVQIYANETAAYMRIFYTLMMQQDYDFFKDPSKIDLSGPEAKKALEFMKKIHDEGLSTLDMDYSAAVSGFSSGEGGIEVNGTWLIGDLDAQSKEEGNALSGGYTVYPVPQFYPAKNATYVDGHGWAVPRGDRDEDKMAAIGKLFKFLEDNDYEWARTGHLPSVKAVFDMPEFKALPHRDKIVEIAKIGQTLPEGVMRQFALQDIVGEELAAAINGNKSVDDALARIEERVNDLLGNL